MPATPSLQDDKDPLALEAVEQPAAARRDFGFWMVFVGNLLVDMPSALDLVSPSHAHAHSPCLYSVLLETAVSTALPTIVDHLHGSDFIWASSAYAIASTAILPIVGGFVSVFGRKPAIVAFIIFFAIGSALCGAAQNMTMFIAGRGTSSCKCPLLSGQLTLWLCSCPGSWRWWLYCRHRDHIRRPHSPTGARQVLRHHRVVSPRPIHPPLRTHRCAAQCLGTSKVQSVASWSRRSAR